MHKLIYLLDEYKRDARELEIEDLDQKAVKKFNKTYSKFEEYVEIKQKRVKV